MEGKDSLNSYKHETFNVYVYKKYITNITEIRNMSQINEMFILFHKQAGHKRMKKKSCFHLVRYLYISK